MLKLPENVELILNKLKEYGSIGYVVGGCVRDTFLGKEPSDWDITTPLLPEVVEKVFQDYKVIETGIKHGTVTVVIDDEQYEITTFRIDGNYSDGRHPDNVNFTNSLIEDLSRRDFTINALAYNPDVGIIDYFDGLSDLENGIIRCVGHPKDRFDEDGLRILRALRFAITLGFNIEGQTLYYMESKREMLSSVSKERIYSELCKMMRTEFPNSFKILYQCLNLFYCITPYFSDSAKSSVTLFEHHRVIESLISTNRNDDAIVRFALLFQFTDDPKKVLTNIRMDNNTSKSVLELLERKDRYKHISYESEERKYEVRKLIKEIGFKNTKYLCNFWQARVMTSSPIKKFQYLKTIKQMKIDAGITVGKNECCTLKQLDITGEDLIEIGYEPSKEIGDVLNLLLDEVLHDPYKNRNKWLIAWAQELKEEREHPQEIMQDSN